MNEKDKELWLKLRHLAQTNLFWLATEILNYKLVEDVHEPLCNFFVQKNPNLPLLYGQSDTRNRLLLYPRGHYKTTVDIADCVQWALAFPNVRLSINSGTIEMGSAILRALKWHFINNEKLLKLFPEYRLDPKNAGTQFSFTVPARTDNAKKEPTYSISTANAVRAGWHYDVMKFDDMVNEQNSKTPEMLQKTIDQFNDIAPLVDPGGYRDVIGTHYNYSDLYMWIKDQKKTQKWKVLEKSACTRPLSPESIILFPFNRAGEPMFSYDELKSKQLEDPYKFNCQYLLDPTPTEDAYFPEDLLILRSIPRKSIHMIRPTLERNIQRVGRVFITWDIGFSDEQTADFSAGVAGWYDTDGRLYIVDLKIGRFSPNELALNIVQMARNWRYYLVRVGIDESGGAKLLEPALRNYMESFNFYFPIDWLKMKRKKNRKFKEILALQPLLKQGRLFFANDLSDFDELIKQFVRFPHYSKDDIPDAMSMLMEYRQNVDTFVEKINYEPQTLEVQAVQGMEILGAGLIG